MLLKACMMWYREELKSNIESFLKKVTGKSQL